MRISELLDSIRKSDIVLPEFQREYVWTLDQAKQLMVSLAKGYPVGGILLWKTDTPPELKNVDVLPDRLGTVQVLLDGQQRLTTLHMLLTGDIPSFYTEDEIQNDPRNLFVHLQDLDFQYFQPSRMKGDPYWQRVTDCFEPSLVNPVQIAERKAADDGADVVAVAGQLYENLNRIRNVREVEVPEQIVPSHADLDEAINIFDRINSQGTKLTDAELALTHITGKWPQARRAMKAKLEDCSARGFDFSLTFMTRALTTAVTNRALFEAVHTRSQEELEAGWAKLVRILDYLMTILPARAFIYSTNDLNTTNALIPLVAYLSLNGGRFADELSIRHATNWLYAALMWGRYTGQTDQRLEADVQLVVRETEPWDALRANIAEQRGRIEVKAADFEGRGVQHALYRAIFILAKAQSAVDWFNGAPLAQTHGARYGIHSHHVFPQARLYERDEWDADNYMHRQAVNEIANRAFLTAETNLEISATPPADYLAAIEDRHPGALAAQFVPLDPGLWRVERFPDFLAARREIMARKLNEFMASLIAEPEYTHQRPITDLIDLGESYVLEFKSTLQWDAVRNERNKALRQSSLKTVNAFMNSQGGTLVIGVEDDGRIYGLDRDIVLTNRSRDRFEQLLVALIADSMGAATAPYFRVRFEDVDERSVCVVDVERTPEPVFMNTAKGSAFYIRVGNTTRGLDHEETLKYVEANW